MCGLAGYEVRYVLKGSDIFVLESHFDADKIYAEAEERCFYFLRFAADRSAELFGKCFKFPI